MSSTNTSQQPAAQATLLFVDDEPNILASLQRLFRPAGYRILTAAGGAQGLEILAKEKVDLIVSDMRMPEMDGAVFLEQASKRWPQVLRILLTGYADLSSAVAAVNKGNIYRYLSKPWEDNDIRITVQQALERQRLEAQVAEQNVQLKELNAGLETRVAAQTQEIRQVLGQLEVTYTELKRSFLTSVRIFSNLIELRDGDQSGHSRRVAEHAYALAQRMSMNDGDMQQVLYAGLLHNIGKLGLPDALINKPLATLSISERAQVMRYPGIGQAALLAVEPLQEAALLIRHHQERYDGQGFPDRLKADAIPLGSRILAIANDYDALQYGRLEEARMTPAQARAYLIANKGQRYDAKLVDAFIAVLDEASTATATQANGTLVLSEKLVPGMVISRDLLTGRGMLLMPRGRVLDVALISKIRTFEREENGEYSIYVKR